MKASKERTVKIEIIHSKDDETYRMIIGHPQGKFTSYVIEIDQDDAEKISQRQFLEIQRKAFF